MPKYVPLDAVEGQEVECARHGLVVVAGFNRRGWPYCRVGGANNCGGKAVILAGGLVEAVRQESAGYVARLAGVGRDQVTEWRKALGVPRFNAGTRRLWAKAASKLHQKKA